MKKFLKFFQVFYANAHVRQVDVPSFSGSFGILPLHVPTLAVLKPGVVSVYEESGTKKFFGEIHGQNLFSYLWLNFSISVSSGTVTVNDDSSVQVLAEEACPIEDLDIQVGLIGSIEWPDIE